MGAAWTSTTRSDRSFMNITSGRRSGTQPAYQSPSRFVGVIAVLEGTAPNRFRTREVQRRVIMMDEDSNLMHRPEPSAVWTMMLALRAALVPGL